MQDIQTKLAARLKADDAKERCGFVLTGGKIVELTNTSPDPENQFRINPADTIAHMKKGVTATWHTHPTSTPNLSGEDYQCFLNWDDLDHYVIGRRDEKVHVERYAVEDGMVVQK